MSLFDMFKCSCNGHVVRSNYCPNCGAKSPLKGTAFNYEGMNFNGKSGSYAVKTNEFREPKKGEFYLSGAVPFAYKATNDLSMKFRIMKIAQGDRNGIS